MNYTRRLISIMVGVFLLISPLFFSAQAGQFEGFAVTAFTITPQDLGADRTFTFSMTGNIYPAEMGQWCGNTSISSFGWELREDIASDFDPVVLEGTENFSRTSSRITTTISRQATIGPRGLAPRPFYILIKCATASARTITESARVSVRELAAGTDLRYSCVGPNAQGQDVYICSPASLSNCSDTSGCRNTSQCNQIQNSICGTRVSGGGPTPAPTNQPPGGNPGGGTGGTTDSYRFQLINPLGGANETLVDVINLVATWIFNIAIPIAVIIIIWAGLRFLVARGDQGEITKARQMLWWAIIGLAIVLIGRGFVTLIQSFLSLDGGSAPTTQQPPGGNP